MLLGVRSGHRGAAVRGSAVVSHRDGPSRLPRLCLLEAGNTSWLTQRQEWCGTTPTLARSFTRTFIWSLKIAKSLRESIRDVGEPGQGAVGRRFTAAGRGCGVLRPEVRVSVGGPAGHQRVLHQDWQPLCVVFQRQRAGKHVVCQRNCGQTVERIWYSSPARLWRYDSGYLLLLLYFMSMFSPTVLLILGLISHPVNNFSIILLYFVCFHFRSTGCCWHEYWCG